MHCSCAVAQATKQRRLARHSERTRRRPSSTPAVSRLGPASARLCWQCSLRRCARRTSSCLQERKAASVSRGGSKALVPPLLRCLQCPAWGLPIQTLAAHPHGLCKQHLAVTFSISIGQQLRHCSMQEHLQSWADCAMELSTVARSKGMSSSCDSHSRSTQSACHAAFPSCGCSPPCTCRTYHSHKRQLQRLHWVHSRQPVLCHCLYGILGTGMQRLQSARLASPGLTSGLLAFLGLAQF